MTTLRPALRLAVYRDLDEEGFGFAIVGESSYGTGDIKSSDQRLLGNADQVDPNKYKNMYQYRPARSATDSVRRSNRLSVAAGVATLTHHGPVWTNQSDTQIELLIMHPDELHAYMNQALDNAKLQGLVPLGINIPDYDCQDSEATAPYWNNAQLTNATVAKQSTRVWRGARALTVTLTAANGYAQTDSAGDVAPGKPAIGWTIARNQTGSGGFAAVVDSDGNVLSTQAFNERRWCLVRNIFTPSVYQVKPRVGGTASGDVVDVNASWITGDDQVNLTDSLPSWFDERFHVTGMRMLVPRETSNSGADVWLLDSCDVKELEEGEDFEFLRWEGDAEPYAVRILKRQHLQNPLMLSINMPYRAPYGEDKSLSSETVGTECPLPRFLAEFKLVLASRWKQRFGHLAPEAAATKLTMAKQHQQARAQPVSGWGTAFNRF